MRPITSRSTLLAVAVLFALLAVTSPLVGAPEALPPGMAKYMVVLWREGTPIPGNGSPPAHARRVTEPDVAKLGGRVLRKYDNRLVILLPKQAARQLRKHDSVFLVQRIWTGESLDDWDQSRSDSRFETGSDGHEIEPDSDVNLEWGPKAYAYDKSGNITAIGPDSYTYDTAGRLIQSTVGGQTEKYKYDSFGNLLEKQITGKPVVTIPVDSASNRLNGVDYDAAGNVLLGHVVDTSTWPSSTTKTYAWDSLSRLTYVRGAITNRRMIYDANDEKIGTWLHNDANSHWIIRDFDGRPLREYAGYLNGPELDWIWQQDHIYAEGTLVAGETETWGGNSILPETYGGRRHMHLDHLGSVRMVTNDDKKSLSEHDYYPFGTTQTATHQEDFTFGSTVAPTTDSMRFAGHQRDFLAWLNVNTTEYLDYMHARYYEPNMGRFLSVDPVMDIESAMANPQMWNRYAYALNNPMVYVDPSGALVSLAGLTSQERNDLLLSLNAVTGNEYGVNNNGDLTVINYGQNASATATQFLDDAISSTNAYTVNARNNNRSVNLMNVIGNDINVDFADFKNMKMSGLNAEAMGLGSNLLHELGHAHGGLLDPPAAGTPGVPASLDAKHITGPTVDFVNQIHRERGLPLRGPSYAPQNTNPTFFSNRVRVPFVDPQTGRMIYVWPKLRPR